MARKSGDVEGELRALVDLAATYARVGDASAAEEVFSEIDENLPSWQTEAPVANNAREW